MLGAKENRHEDQGGWTLLGAPKGIKLRRVTITFPSTTSHAGGKTTRHIVGPTKVNIRVEHGDGTSETISNVAIEWA
jgi:hypothetical protein